MKILNQSLAAALIGLSISASAEPKAIRQLNASAGVEQDNQTPAPIEGEAVSGVILTVSDKLFALPTAKDVADLLAGLPMRLVCSEQRHSLELRSESCHGGTELIDLQRSYMEHYYYIRWDQRSLSDVYNTIVPALRKENRQLAIKLWEKTQKPVSEKEERTKGGSQNAESDFEQTGGSDLPENKPYDERQRKYPFPL